MGIFKTAVQNHTASISLEKFRLTKTETLVIKSLLLGMNRKEFCEIHNVRQKTVKFHLTNIYKKTGCNSIVEVILIYCSIIAEKIRLADLTMEKKKKKWGVS